MKNKIIAIFAALVMAFALLASTGTPATSAPAEVPNVTKVQAKKGTFNDLYHAVDDTGFNDPIHVVCRDGRQFHLGLGDGTASRCGFHVERVVVPLNETVRCFNTIPPYQTITYYSLNYNHVPSASSLRCYNQRPL